MIRSALFRRYALALLLAPAAGAVAQEIVSVLGQKTWPETIKISELPANYKAVKLKLTGTSGGGPFDAMGSMSFFMLMSFSQMGRSGEAEQLAAMDAMSMLEISFTRGENTKMHDTDYLVTYRFEPSMSELSTLNKGISALADAPLRLTFVKVSEIQSMTPRADITKEMFSAATPVPHQDSQAVVSAKKAATISNVKQVALGMIMYTSDYDDVYPWAQSSKTAWSVIEPYTKNKELFKTLNPNGGELRFNMCLGGTSAVDCDRPAETPMIYETNTWPDGKRVVGFADGHVQAVDGDRWQALQPMLKLKIKKTAKKPLPANYDPYRFNGT